MRVARIAFSRSHPNDIGIGGCQSDRSYALSWLVIEQRLPFYTCCLAAPQASTSRSHIHHFWTVALNINGRNPTTHGTWTDVPNVHSFDKSIQILGLYCAPLARKQEQ